MTNPKEVHGMYLPSIKVWNDFFKGFQETLKEEFRLAGSIEDLLLDNPHAVCDECDSKLVRVESEFGDGYFVSGLIYCFNSDSEGHSKKGWLEVWPNANILIPRDEIWELDVDEIFANVFAHSDKRVSDCYIHNTLYFHRMDIQACTDNKIPILEKNLKPVYIHRP